MSTIFRYALRLLAVIGLALIILAALFYLRYRHPEAIVVAEAGPTALQNRAGLEGFALSLLLQIRAEDINTPLSSASTPISFSIEPGESTPVIAARLQAMGLISDSQLFRRFLHYNGLDTSLEAGHYDLRANMTMKEIGLALQKARAEEAIITIPEGWRAEQIADLLTAENIMAGDQFLAVVREGTVISHPLLVDRPSSRGYEGYLYPDTYRLPLESRPEDLISRMLDNLAGKLPPNALGLTANQGLTFYEALTIAAIVEREAVLSKERPLIASVYLNRLGPDSPRKFLEADPTVQYAMGYQQETDQWWKTPVTLEEYSEVDSPYNTYLYPGLPPGPIANPGIDAIMAVLNPAETPYFYFVCRYPGCKDGEHVFAETYEEHLENVSRYYGQ